LFYSGFRKAAKAKVSSVLGVAFCPNGWGAKKNILGTARERGSSALEKDRALLRGETEGDNCRTR